jgi:hypothetical protein
MSTISFAPVSQRDMQMSEAAALRISLVENGTSRKWQPRSVSLDLRIHPDVLADWGVDAGDRVVGTVDADGSWAMTKCEPGQRGYMVRIGGKPSATSRTTSRGGRRKVHGKQGFAYFRFSCSRANARAVFGNRTRIECDLAGVDGAVALFIPKVAAENVMFQPAV